LDKCHAGGQETTTKGNTQMQKILLSLLVGVSFMASAETMPTAEQLMTSGDPAQVSIGYQHCGAVMMVLGNAAVRSNPEEGAGYIASGQRYSKLFRNATDLRTEDKRNTAQGQVTKLIQTYGEMVKTDSKRPFMLSDFKFCQKWIEEF
jgi:hypothetical protein